MKLNKEWPSAYQVVLQFSGSVAYIKKYNTDPEGERKALLEACNASAVRVSVSSDGEYNLHIDIEWSALKNDERIIKALGWLKERYGVFSFHSTLVVDSTNKAWSALVACYKYDPARFTGIRRTYLSCAECALICRTTPINDISAVFEGLLTLRDQETMQEVGGILYVDFQNHPVVNKKSVLLEAPVWEETKK